MPMTHQRTGTVIEPHQKDDPVAAAAAAALQTGFRGNVISAGDPGYDGARAVWNASIDRYPGVIAQCTGAADVVRAVGVARQLGMLVSIRGGGHNVAGLAVCDGGMVIDLSPMKRVHVDPVRRIARAQPGLRWGEFDHETQLFGLATPGGLLSTTGIAGFTLGGGFGWLSRRYGLACDNLLSADLVTADGRVVTASPTENSDLFWGLRGGGGNFGVVTAFDYRLHEVGPTILGGLVVHRLDDAALVLRELREYFVSAPQNVMFNCILRIAPPAPFLPDALHGKHVLMVGMCHVGPIDEGERLLQPVRLFNDPVVDIVAPRPYTALQSFFDSGWVAGFQNYWKAEYISLADAAVDAIVEHAASITSPLSDIKIGGLGGGAIGRVDEGDSAYAHRRAPFLLNINARWAERGDGDERHVAWAQGLWSAVRPASFGGVYVNFLGQEGQDRVRAAYGAATYERLSRLKRAYDPDNFFRVNQNIKPSPA